MNYDAWLAEQQRNRHEEREREREREKLASDAERDDRLPYVYCELPRCPTCYATTHRLYRSVSTGDGSRMKWAECDECKTRFIQVWE
ncbi:MAG TPA: hypothetical protein VFW73_06975 [Lacipirellulaceae bacterium]|nr:hypothetical protein [Lacipirellulaceae bacterium]